MASVLDLLPGHEARVSSVRPTYADPDEAIRVHTQKETWINHTISSLLVICALPTETICSSSLPLLTSWTPLFLYRLLIFSLAFCAPPPTLLLSFNHPLSSIPHTSRPSASPWLPFIRPKPHFLQSAYSGRPFSLQMQSFCWIKALVQKSISTTIYYAFSSPSCIHACVFFL